MSRRATPVFSVTTARRSRAADIDHRERNYAITMTVRTLFFVLAAFLPIPVWARLLLILCSLVLPWVAVTYANGGQVREAPSATLLDHPDGLELEGPRRGRSTR